MTRRLRLIARSSTHAGRAERSGRDDIPRRGFRSVAINTQQAQDPGHAREAIERCAAVGGERRARPSWAPYLGESVAAPEGWEHLRTVARVEVETFDTKGNRISREDRYFVSSLPRSRLTDEQWLLLVRRHWGVETAHQILDGAFDEDKHPWIEQHPRATAVVMVLRRIAYTLLVLWRDVTLRSDDNRSRPWSWIMRDIFLCLLTATAERLRNQRSMPLLT
jgi:hypothetical protein